MDRLELIAKLEEMPNNDVHFALFKEMKDGSYGYMLLNEAVGDRRGSYTIVLTESPMVYESIEKLERLAEVPREVPSVKRVEEMANDIRFDLNGYYDGSDDNLPISFWLDEIEKMLKIKDFRTSTIFKYALEAMVAAWSGWGEHDEDENENPNYLVTWAGVQFFFKIGDNMVLEEITIIKE